MGLEKCVFGVVIVSGGDYPHIEFLSAEFEGGLSCTEVVQRGHILLIIGYPVLNRFPDLFV